MRFFPAISLAQAVSTAAVLVTGGYLFWDGRVTIGTVAAVALYLTSLFEPVGQARRLVQRAPVGSRGVDEDRRPARDAGQRRAGRARRCRTSGDLVVDSAFFSYDSGPPAVDGVSMDDPPGRAPRARGCDRRRKVDAREAAHAPVRPAGWVGAVRRPRPARRVVGVAARADRLPPAGGAPVRRLDRRERAARAAGCVGRGGRVGARADRRARALQRTAGGHPHGRPDARRAAVIRASGS